MESTKINQGHLEKKIGRSNSRLNSLVGIATSAIFLYTCHTVAKQHNDYLTKLVDQAPIEVIDNSQLKGRYWLHYSKEDIQHTQDVWHRYIDAFNKLNNVDIFNAPTLEVPNLDRRKSRYWVADKKRN